MNNHLVSIITPTLSTRGAHLQRLKACVEAQTYDNIEWIVITGDEATIGEKRNKACEMAQGQYIVNFDDDDYYAPSYIGDALAHLISNNLDVTGLRTAYFTNLATAQAWEYEYKGRQPYVLGSGMLYKRSAWERNKYPHKSIGEDTDFVTNAGRVNAFNGKELFYATLHGANTASHQALHTFKFVDFRIFADIFKHIRQCNTTKHF